MSACVCCAVRVSGTRQWLARAERGFLLKGIGNGPPKVPSGNETEKSKRVGLRRLFGAVAEPADEGKRAEKAGDDRSPGGRLRNVDIFDCDSCAAECVCVLIDVG